MRRALLFCAAIAFAIACGDDITEPIPDRTVAAPPVAFATTTTEDGLTITTDKDDYAPGDTVHFTGRGWQVGDVLDIVLVDDAVTQETHTWTVTIGEDGTFRDSTYVVDTDDIGVTFTLTATSRATGRSLTVVFTDGNFKYSTTPNNLVATIAFQKRSGATCGAGTLEASGTFSNNSNSNIVTGSHYDITVPSVTGYTYNGYTSSGNVTISPASSPSNNVLCIVTSANNGSGSIDLAYLDNTTTELGHSPASTNVGQQVTFTATVKDHNGDPVGNKGSVTFYEFSGAQTCDALGSATALAGPVNLTNSPSGQASFQTSTLAVGTHTITGCYNGTTAFKKSFGSVSHPVSAVAVATNTGVTTSQTPTGFGESVTFTVTVTSGSPATAVTTGSVTFKEGATCAGTELQAAQAVNSSGQVTFTTTTLPIGPHTIRGCYGGAAGFLASEGSVVQQVNSTATDLNLVSSINPSVTGQSSTFTATVTNNSSPVTTGQVAFKTGGTNCSDATQVQAPQTPNGSGIVSYSASFTASQSGVAVRACYGGSTTPLLAASEATVSQVINEAETSTAVTTSKTPTVFSEPVTFNVTVTTDGPGSGTPAGNVTLKDGSCAAASSLAGPTALDGSGKVSFSDIDNIAVGSHTIAACYAGNVDFSSSNGSVSQTVDQASTTTAIGSSANPSVFSQSVTFTATVSKVSPATATPAGNVSFEQGGTVCGSGTSLGSVALNGSGQASFTSSDLAVGSHTIRACYAGNSNFKGSHNALTQIVNKATTTTALTSDHNPSVFSQLVTFTATVGSVSPATTTPTGSVTFEEGGTACGAGTTVLSTETLNASGQATFSTLAFAVGTYTIRACYAETDNFKASANSLSQVVNKALTSTGITSSINPTVYSEPVGLHVEVTVTAPGTAVPVGNVTLREGTCLAGTVLGGPTAVDAAGKATFNVSTLLSVGSHTITACYAGNDNFEKSEGSVTQQVNKASTTTAILSSVNPSLLNQPVTFSVTVSPVSPAVAPPQGNVTLKDGTCLAGLALGGPTALNGSGQASFNISTLAIGSHTVTACYAGNTNFESSDGFVSQGVHYKFLGFFAPVDRPNTMNLSKAGQAIPLKWRLADYNNVPITNLTAVNIKVSSLSCGGDPSTDLIEEYAPGASGLQNFGDGSYQFNWKTPPAYASLCKNIGLDFGSYVEVALANFNFKK